MLFNPKQHAIKIILITSITFTCNLHATSPIEQKQNSHERSDQQNNHHAEYDSSGFCRNERNLRSVQGNAHTTIKFLNNRKQEVRIYWLDYTGRRVYYKTIPPHDQYTQPTFQTHPWVVADQRDNCTNIFVSNKQSTIAEIH